MALQKLVDADILYGTCDTRFAATQATGQSPVKEMKTLA
jgi:hypothetical protein